MTPDLLPDFGQECFLISPIGDENSATRRTADGVRDYIVRPAAEEVGLLPVRADEIDQPGQITLQVIQHVLNAKAAVADLTGANPNVFYELAIRHTARLPVVLIAHVADRHKLPFDIAPMRTIFYDHRDLRSAADCRAQITAQLYEALAGAVDSPVAASVNLSHLQGGNPSEQVLAQLVGTVEGMAVDTDRLERMIAQLERSISAPPDGADPDVLRDLVTAVRRLDDMMSTSRDDGGLLGHAWLARSWSDILRTFGEFTGGAVIVAFLYELLFADTRDTAVVTAVLKDSAMLARITSEVTEGLVPGTNRAGLAEVVEQMEFNRLFENLVQGDELLWLATYVEFDFRQALREALERGATVRMLMIHPHSPCLEMRAQELTPYYRDRYYQNMVAASLYDLNEIQHPQLQIATYSDLPNIPMFVVCRGGYPVYGFTGLYLTQPIVRSVHFRWRAGEMLQQCVVYFEKKWRTNAVTEREEDDLGGENANQDDRHNP
jgi:hypothetical protein